MKVNFIQVEKIKFRKQVIHFSDNKITTFEEKFKLKNTIVEKVFFSLMIEKTKPFRLRFLFEKTYVRAPMGK